MNNTAQWGDPRLQEILVLLKQMQKETPEGNAKTDTDPLDTDLFNTDLLNTDPLDALLAQVQSIHKYYTEADKAYSTVEQRLSDTMETIMALARLDFARRASVTDRGDVIDAVALGLNMLGEELHATYVSNSYVDNIIHSMLNTLVVVTPDSSIKLVNRAALELLEYEDYELVGRSINRVFLPNHYDNIVQRLQSEQMVGGIEEVYITQSGVKVPVLLSGALMHNEAGTVNGIVFVAQDITERKAEQIALERAKDAAEMAARAKSQFLANMSHEIRTPLNGIIGMANLLFDTALTEAQYEQAETILRSSDSLLDIVNDILDFSKVEAGKIDLEEQPFILNDCIEDCLDLVATKAAKKRLEIIYKIEDKLNAEAIPTLIGDVTRIRQILTNLLSNAVKFTNEGEIIVRAWLRAAQDKQATRLENERLELCLSVQDSGIGIPTDRFEQIFDSFSQADVSTTRRYGGTGLGLSISKLLCETMGGRIWVESEEGSGSTFFCTINIARATKGKPFKIYHQNKLANKSLLLVDDNATVRKILIDSIAKWEMSGKAVASATEALSLLASGNHYDVCLIDSQMPNLDGYALINQIRQNSRYNNINLVLLKTVSESERSDIQQYITATVTKPIKLRSLAAALVEATTQKIRPQIASHQKIDEPIARSHPLRILLAEDNIVNQKVALLLLKKFGYAADIAANGVEAIDALKQQHYDVILMDIQMPEMDGLEATKQILAGWTTSQRPRIIAMTANALKGDRERYLAEGMDDYVSKPISADALAHALQQVRPLPPTGTYPTIK